MPAPSTYFLAETEAGPHGRIIGAVKWFSESTGKPQNGGGNQWRRADALYRRSLEDGFRCIVCGTDLPLTSKADRLYCSHRCCTRAYEARKSGKPDIRPKVRPYKRKNQEEYDQQMMLKRQMGLAPWPKVPKEPVPED